MTIIDQAIDARTTDPRWWTTKAVCHIRRAEWDQAEQSLGQADTHWRSPHALSTVVRLILAQARQLPASDTSPTPVDVSVLTKWPGLPLEAEILRRELQ